MSRTLGQSSGQPTRDGEHHRPVATADLDQGGRPAWCRGTKGDGHLPRLKHDAVEKGEVAPRTPGPRIGSRQAVEKLGLDEPGG